MSGNISFTGIGGGGGEFNQIIDALVQARRGAQIKPMEDWKTEWEGKIETVNIVDSVLSSFFTLVKSMDRINELKVQQASSSDTTKLEVSATSDAVTGSHAVVIDQLAKVEKEIHTTGETSKTDVVNNSGGSQTFIYSYAGNNTSVTVPNNTTLEGLVNLINGDTGNPGVKASLLDTGSAVHLVLSGNDTGASNDIEIDPLTTATLTGYKAGDFTESQAATSAQIRVDGFPAASWIERDANSISDVIPGLTLTLVGTGDVNITVATDKTAIMDKLDEFRESFNEVRSIIKAAGNYDPVAEQAGPLMGNYALQIVKSRLDSIMNSVPPGFDRNTDTYSTLMQLGFYTDAEQGSATQGLLLLDTDKLSKALDDDPDAVIALMSSHLNGATDSSDIVFSSSLMDFAQPGIYSVEVDTTIGTNGQGRFKLEGGSWSDWFGLEGSAASGTLMLTAATGDARGVSLRINNTGYMTAQLRLRNGVITEASRELNRVLSPTTLPSGERVEGPLKGIVKNYTDIIKTIDKRVESEERRIEAYEVLLRQRFARLDSLMGRMGGMSAALGGITQNM